MAASASASPPSSDGDEVSSRDSGAVPRRRIDPREVVADTGGQPVFSSHTAFTVAPVAAVHEMAATGQQFTSGAAAEMLPRVDRGSFSRDGEADGGSFAEYGSAEESEDGYEHEAWEEAWTSGAEGSDSQGSGEGDEHWEEEDEGYEVEPAYYEEAEPFTADSRHYQRYAIETAGRDEESESSSEYSDAEDEADAEESDVEEAERLAVRREAILSEVTASRSQDDDSDSDAPEELAQATEAERNELVGARGAKDDLDLLERGVVSARAVNCVHGHEACRPTWKSTAEGDVGADWGEHGWTRCFVRADRARNGFWLVEVETNRIVLSATRVDSDFYISTYKDFPGTVSRASYIAQAADDSDFDSNGPSDDSDDGLHRGGTPAGRRRRERFAGELADSDSDEEVITEVERHARQAEHTMRRVRRLRRLVNAGAFFSVLRRVPKKPEYRLYSRECDLCDGKLQKFTCGAGSGAAPGEILAPATPVTSGGSHAGHESSVPGPDDESPLGLEDVGEETTAPRRKRTMSRSSTLSRVIRSLSQASVLSGSGLDGSDADSVTSRRSVGSSKRPVTLTLRASESAYTVSDSACSSPKEVPCSMTNRQVLGVIRHETVHIDGGADVARQLKIQLPMVDKDGNRAVWCPRVRRERDAAKASVAESALASASVGYFRAARRVAARRALDRLEDQMRPFLLESALPRWSAEQGSLVLDFGTTRANVHSTKNFCVRDDSGQALLSIGKLDNYRYSVDFRHPVAPVQAFSVFLSSVGWSAAPSHDDA